MTGAGQMAGSMVKGWLSKGVLKPTQVDMIFAVSDIEIIILSNCIALSTPPYCIKTSTKALKGVGQCTCTRLSFARAVDLPWLCWWCHICHCHRHPWLFSSCHILTSLQMTILVSTIMRAHNVIFRNKRQPGGCKLGGGGKTSMLHLNKEIMVTSTITKSPTSRTIIAIVKTI